MTDTNECVKHSKIRKGIAVCLSRCLKILEAMMWVILIVMPIVYLLNHSSSIHLSEDFVRGHTSLCYFLHKNNEDLRKAEEKVWKLVIDCKWSGFNCRFSFPDHHHQKEINPSLQLDLHLWVSECNSLQFLLPGDEVRDTRRLEYEFTTCS